MPIRFKFRRTFAQSVRRFLRSRRGNIAALTALLIIPLAALMGMATEGGGWFLAQRAAQNAADSAAIAAATNGNSLTYVQEAKSVTSSYGFLHGSNNTTVNVINTDNSVPAICNSNCYRVTVTRIVPLFLLPIIGFTGDSALGNGRGQTIVASAVARPKSVPTTYCILSLGLGDDFHNNGANSADLKGCYVRVNGDVTCNGSNASANAGLIVYVGDNKNGKCAPSKNVTNKLGDPYTGYASNIPTNTCGSSASGYAQGHLKKSPTWKTLVGGVITGPTIYCGDTQLVGDLSLSAGSPDAAIIIEDGELNLQGHTLTSAGVPIIFTGPVVPGLSPSQYPTGGGALDIIAPNSGPWSGVAIYQSLASSITSVDITYSGSSPSWTITGLVYLPKANLTFSGAVGKKASGAACMVLVDLTVQVNGTGSIYANSQSQCSQAGLTPPTDGSAVRVSLVQ